MFGNLIGWCANRQKSVSLSTAESEYVALSACAQFGKWYRTLVADMGLELAFCRPMVILSDSKSAIQIARSPVPVVNKYSKHIERRVHWFRELIREGTLTVMFVEGIRNVADILTKCLGKTKFREFRDSLLLGDFRVLEQLVSTACILELLYNPLYTETE